MRPKEVHIAIIGAGPSGAAVASGLAKKVGLSSASQGFQDIHLFEGRNRYHVKSGIFEDPNASRSKEITGGEGWSFYLGRRAVRNLNSVLDDEAMQELRKASLETPIRRLWYGQKFYEYEDGTDNTGPVFIRRTALVETTLAYMEKHHSPQVTTYFGYLRLWLILTDGS